jgi:hypothetical protein
MAPDIRDAEGLVAQYERKEASNIDNLRSDNRMV